MSHLTYAQAKPLAGLDALARAKIIILATEFSFRRRKNDLGSKPTNRLELAKIGASSLQ